MKHFDDLESQLRKKLPPMRSSFKVDLRAKLYQNAEQQFNSSSRWTSVLSLLPLFMKRYSIPAMGLTMAFVMAISFALPPSISPLSAEEVLAQVQESYQNDAHSGQIYHEEVLIERFKNGKLDSSRIDEDYLMPDSKSYLAIEKDSKTHEMVYVELSYFDENGDGTRGMAYYGDESDDSADDRNATLNEGQLKWIDAFKGEKLYCYQEFDFDASVAKAYLTFAAENQSVFQSGGVISTKSFLNQLQGAGYPASSVFNMNRGVGSFVEALGGLMDSDDYEYDFVKEDGKMYYVFEQSEFFELEPEPTFINNYYINPDTFQLEKIVTQQVSGELISRRTLLTSEFIDPSHEKEVFDVSQFDHMELSDTWFAYDPIYDFSTPGCYDNEGQLITTDIDSYISEEASDEFEHLEQLAITANEAIGIETAQEIYIEAKNTFSPDEEPFKASSMDDLSSPEEVQFPEGN